MASSTPSNTTSTGVDASALPADHLSHPESWATGADPATSKQLGFIAVLEKQKDLHIPEERLEGVGKSEASELIDGLKHGKVPPPHDDKDGFPTGPGEKRDADEVEKDDSEVKDGEDRKKKRKTDADKEDVSKTEEKADKTDGDKEMKDAEPASDKSNGTNSDDTKTDDKSKTDTEESKTKSPKKSASPKKSNGDGDVVATTITPDKDAVNKADGEDDHLDHPEKWATGDDPATEKQLGYLAVLEKQKGVKTLTEAEREGDLGKSEASEKIEALKDQ